MDFGEDHLEPDMFADDSPVQRRLTPNEMLQQQMQQAVAGFQTGGTVPQHGSYTPTAMPSHMHAYLAGMHGGVNTLGFMGQPGEGAMYGYCSVMIVT